MLIVFLRSIMRPPQFIRGPEPSRTQAVFLHSRPKRGICAEALIVAAEAWMSLNGLAKANDS